MLAPRTCITVKFTWLAWADLVRVVDASWGIGGALDVLVGAAQHLRLTRRLSSML